MFLSVCNKSLLVLTAAVVEIFREMFSLGGVRVEMANIEILKEDTDWALAKQNFTLYSNQGGELFTAK